MADRIVRKLRLYYISGSIVLLLLEIFIALFMRDSFVRPFLGDFLVVILLYMIIRSFFPIGAPWLPTGVFAFFPYRRYPTFVGQPFYVSIDRRCV